MKLLECVVVMVLLRGNFLSCRSTCLQDKEDVFAIKNYFQNRVFADGKETTFYIIDQASLIYGFCIPHQATVVAVTNTLSLFPPVSFFGSIGERLLTNSEWKCVRDELSVDWYQPWYNDTTWPNAYSKKPLTQSAFISKNAQTISSVQNTSNQYYCRGRIKERPRKKEPSSRSAMAARIAKNQRLENHLIKLFLVDEIMQCLTHCLDFEQCVSMNYEQNSKTCELNSEINTKYPEDMEQREGYSYYNIIKQ